MKKLLLITFLILSACSSKSSMDNSKNNVSFNENMTFEQFKISLKEYVENSSYPNIDN